MFPSFSEANSATGILFFSFLQTYTEKKVYEI